MGAFREYVNTYMILSTILSYLREAKKHGIYVNDF